MATLITGASSGIGKELAKIFAESGQSLILVARNRPALESLAKEIFDQYQVRAEVISADLSEPGGAAQVAQVVAAQGSRIENLVNNAGYGLFGEFAQTDLATERKMIQLNITALTELTKFFLPSMLEEKKGRIMNVASTASFVPGPYMAVYYATKAYVLSFTEALQGELEGTGVTATALCPGPTASGFQAVAGLENSPLIKNLKMPSSEKVALEGYRAMMKGKRVHVTSGLMNIATAELARFLPRRLVTSIVKSAQKTRHANKQ